jgi:hypothetical protein
MSNNKQSSVERFHIKTWALKIQLELGQISIGEYATTYHALLVEAKEMEKERMKGMYVEGSFAKMRYYDGLEYIDAEQYYKETYGGNK